MRGRSPLISVIFPNYNGDIFILKTLLNSLNKQNYPKTSLEVILVDNGSSKKIPAQILKSYSFLKIIKLKTNTGFSKAVNQGLNKAKGDYFFITNNDVKLHPSCLKVLVSYIFHHPEIGIIGPKTYYFDNPKTIAFSALKHNVITNKFRLTGDPDKIQKTDWVPGHGIFFSKKLLQKIGLFDERFFFYFEDIDFCFRAKKAGFEVMYYPAAVIWHKGSATSHLNEKQRLKSLYHHHRSRQLFLLKQARFYQLALGLLYQFGKYVPYYFFKRDGSLKSFFKAINDPNQQHSLNLNKIKNIILLSSSINRPFFFNILRYLVTGNQHRLKNFVSINLKKYRCSSVLDICSGTGDFVQKNLNYTGIDINSRFISYARKKYQAPNIQFFQGNALKPPFSDSSFDASLLISVLHHFSDKDATKLLEKTKRLTKKLVILIDLIPFPSNILKRFFVLLDQGEYVREEKKKEKLIRQYFKIIATKKIYSGLSEHYGVIAIPKI